MIRSPDPDVDAALDDIAAVLEVDRDELPPRLTKQQVATVFNVAPSTTDTWVSQPQYPDLAFYKVGGRRLYPVTGVARALRSTLRRYTEVAA